MEKNGFSDRSWIQVIIAAGGTGGHIFPAQALAVELMQKEERIEIIFMSARLRENLYFRKEAFKFREISSATPFKKSPLAILKSFGSIFKGMFQSFAYFIKKRPKLVIGFGSFYSFPVIFAAKVLFIPIVLFESDVYPGRVNRLCCRFADLTAVRQSIVFFVSL
ncbi:MAG: glycosyltransferase [Simkania negevensis]|nr:glycosyltransferase [Simkania negevensis]